VFFQLLVCGRGRVGLRGHNVEHGDAGVTIV
jgi:hypothetical protein